MQSNPLPRRPFAVRDEGAGRVVLESRGSDAAVMVVTGYAGPPLPPDIEGAVLQQVGPGKWRLEAAGATIDFAAGGLELIQPQPRLFDGLLAAFALKPRDRRRVGILLRLLRLPGGAWLLRRWHARRK